MDTTDYRDLFDDREDFKFANFHGDGIGISIGHEAGGGTGTSHAEASGVVDDDEVGSAFLNKLGGDACSCSSTNNGFAFGESVMKTLEHFVSCIGISDPGPWIRHNVVRNRNLVKSEDDTSALKKTLAGSE